MEVWLPWIEGTLPLLFAALVILLAVLQRPRSAPMRALSSLSTVCTVALSLLASFFLLSAQSCEEDRALIGSPDGRHVARLMIYGNVPAGTSLRVIERRSWSPTWTEVSGAGSVGTPLDPIEPRITWADNYHLVLDYPVATDGSGFACMTRRVGDIFVVCKTHVGRRWN